MKRPSVGGDMAEVFRRLEALERSARGEGLKPPWTQDDEGHVTGTTIVDDTVLALPLYLEARGTGGTKGLSVSSYSGDGVTPDNGGEAIGLDMGGASTSHAEARVEADAARAIGVQMDVDSNGADAYGIRGTVDGHEDGQSRGVDLDVLVDGFGESIGALLDVSCVDGIATGLKVTGVTTGIGKARGIDVSPTILMRSQAVEPPGDAAGAVLYLFDNAGTQELRININGVVSTLATE